jgi:hypothetical protein
LVSDELTDNKDKKYGKNWFKILNIFKKNKKS